MIRFDQVTFTYDGNDAPALRDATFDVHEGELALVIGRTGAGKSTLLGLINGLVPHFTGGHLAGSVTIVGRDTRHHKPRDLADVVGVVSQDPLAGFVTDTVEEELAYGMEQLAIEPSVMRKRVEETLDLLGIAELRNRPLRTLSGGQQQRVAIGAVLTAHPRVLVLDEPTSALDPTAAEDVLAAITRLVHDLGVTVVMAEHRMERVVQYADRIITVQADGSVAIDDPAAALATSPIAPPIVHLGRLAGWDPLPLSVRDARRLAAPLRQTLAACDSQARTPGSEITSLTADGIVVRYGDVVAVREVSLDLPGGRVVALMGRNGSGKSSLLWALHGAGDKDAGTVEADGKVALVPQSPSDLLYLDTVAGECAQADKDTGRDPGTCRALVDRLVPGLPDDRHPRDLSEGQRLALVLAIQLTAQPLVVLLDEPTRGLDYEAKDHLGTALRELATEGHAIVVATHDVEFVASFADEVLVMAEGEIVAHGPTAEVVASSPAFAPQVAKILSPDPWLTVAQVRAALDQLQ
ncbi:MAG: ATP-binding cassette domain-containing protein [Acidimicrobiales bacterium]|nr:ATP-binding cassette domain-containing protein [Acidimicrobiales bacterium]